MADETQSDKEYVDDESGAEEKVAEDADETEEQSIREEIGNETEDLVEFHLYDGAGAFIQKTKIIDKKNKIITLFPFTVSPVNGVTKPRIQEIQLRGWSSINDLPGFLKSGSKVSLNTKTIAPLFHQLKSDFPKFKTLIIHRTGGHTSFSATKIEFKNNDLRDIHRTTSREINSFNDRKRATIQNSLAELSPKFKKKYLSLNKGAISKYLGLYDTFDLNAGDVDILLGVLADIPVADTKITTNFIETKNRVSAAYLDDVIDEYRELMSAKNDNEKEWQKFFGVHGWILASVFPYQVILKGREAYLGGKTMENDGARLVDFLFQSGFRDNYALLEIKTHNTPLLKDKAYRPPHAFAMHDKCSGAIAQCLDQKNTFITDIGRASSFDPKVVLVIGQKSNLSADQTPAFELLRGNQKGVDLITFDELFAKVTALRNLLVGAN